MAYGGGEEGEDMNGKLRHLVAGIRQNWRWLRGVGFGLGFGRLKMVIIWEYCRCNQNNWKVLKLYLGAVKKVGVSRPICCVFRNSSINN